MARGSYEWKECPCVAGISVRQGLFLGRVFLSGDMPVAIFYFDLVFFSPARQNFFLVVYQEKL